MGEPTRRDQETISDLARVKALFQQRSILAHLGQMPPGSKDDQETRQQEQPR